jgi:hypothetical protein
MSTKKWLEFINPLSFIILLCLIGIMYLMTTETEIEPLGGPTVANEGVAVLVAGLAAPALALFIFANVFVKNIKFNLLLQWGLGGVYLLYILRLFFGP